MGDRSYKVLGEVKEILFGLEEWEMHLEEQAEALESQAGSRDAVNRSEEPLARESASKEPSPPDVVTDGAVHVLAQNGALPGNIFRLTNEGWSIRYEGKAALAANTSIERRSSLERELAKLEQELKRLTMAVAAGGELTSLVEAVTAGEKRRRELQSELASLTSRRAEFDGAKLRQQLAKRLADWRGLLRRYPVQGQQVLKRLIDGRLTFEPTVEGDERYYRFTGTGTVEPLLAGQMVQKLASPRGILPFTMHGTVVPKVA